MISLSSIDYSSYSSRFSGSAELQSSNQAQAAESKEQSLHSLSRSESTTSQTGLSTRVHVRLTRTELYENVAQTAPQNPYAATIVSAISSQLAIDASEGASDEELQSRWEAGLQGFIEGFNDAKDQLDAIGALDSSVSSAINDTYNQVLAGLEEQAAKYGLESDSLEQYRDNSAQESTSSPAIALPSQSSNPFVGRQVESLATRNDFSFQLRTNDGDLVMIEVAAAQAKAAAYETNEHGAGLAYTSQSSSAFNFSVQGELDADELSAINDLLNQVNEISDTFFNGDVQDAFNLALEVGYDSSEINSFALSLSQTSVQQSTTYAPAATAHTDPGLGQKLLPISDFASLVDDTSQTAAKLKLNQQLISELSEQFAKANHRDSEGTQSIKSFVEQFLPTS